MKKYEKILSIIFVVIMITVNCMVKYSVTKVEYMTMRNRDKSILGSTAGLFFLSLFLLADSIKSIKNNIKNNNKFFSKKNKLYLVQIILVIAIFVFGISVIIYFKNKYWEPLGEATCVTLGTTDQCRQAKPLGDVHFLALNR